MNKLFRSVTIMVLLCGMLVMASSGVIYAKDQKKNNLSPNSPVYFMDRLMENITETFLSSEKKVDFYLERSVERFEEAVVMFDEDDSDRAFELLKEGLGNVTKAIKAWKVCLEKDIDLSDLEEDFKETLGDVLEAGKDTFSQLKKDLNFSKIAEISKEIADIIKEQIQLFLD